MGHDHAAMGHEITGQRDNDHYKWGHDHGGGATLTTLAAEFSTNVAAESAPLSRWEPLSTALR